METTAIFISILALVFTVGSFWSMNWRTGKLIVGEPRSYAANILSNGELFMHFPFVFYNSGPLPLFIQNLRIVFPNESPTMPLVFTATVDKLATDEGSAIATQFPLNGRDTILLICTFHRTKGKTFQVGKYPMELQAMLKNNNKGWETVCSFDLNVSAETAEQIPKRFTAHYNILAL